MKKKKIIIVVIVIFVLLLIPIPIRLKDGGSIEYKAILYKYTKIHRLNEKSSTGYEDGWEFNILGIYVGGKINVYDENKQNSSDSVSLSLKANTLTSKGATIVLKNNTNKDYVYGPDYYIEIQENGEWREIDTITGNPLVWNAIAYILKSNEKKEINIDWSLVYSELSEGQYRLVKKVFKEEDRPIDNSKILYLYLEFYIDTNNSAKLEITKANAQNANKFNIYLEKDEKIIYLSSVLEEVYYVNGNSKISLKDFISKSYQTTNDSIKHITNLLDYVDTYKDGGSILYKSKKYDIALLKCNTLDGNKDIYIGDSNMSYDNDMCRR
ncbi:MAG: hypothetical protein IJ068_00385 [Bacilli bacterium]|nr:hypothetical protein [Bacilli bacterium]